MKKYEIKFLIPNPEKDCPTFSLSAIFAATQNPKLKREFKYGIPMVDWVNAVQMGLQLYAERKWVKG